MSKNNQSTVYFFQNKNFGFSQKNRQVEWRSALLSWNVNKLPRFFSPFVNFKVVLDLLGRTFVTFRF